MTEPLFEFEQWNPYRFMNMPPKYLEETRTINVIYLEWWQVQSTPPEVEKRLAAINSDQKRKAAYQQVLEEARAVVRNKSVIHFAHCLISKSTDDKLQELLRNKDHDRYVTPMGREITFNLLVRMAKEASLEEELRAHDLLNRERFVNRERFLPPTSRTSQLLEAMYLQVYGE